MLGNLNALARRRRELAGGALDLNGNVAQRRELFAHRRHALGARGGGTLSTASNIYDLQAGAVNAALGTGTLNKTTGGTVYLNGTAAATAVNVSGGNLCARRPADACRPAPRSPSRRPTHLGRGRIGGGLRFDRRRDWPAAAAP